MASQQNELSSVPGLNWVRTGTAHAQTILLIHAVGLDLTYWDRQIDVLEADYNVVAFDLPGHGRPPGTPEEWSFDTSAAMVANLIQTVSDAPVHLVGISFGGMIAQATVLAAPELVRSLTLIGTAATFSKSARQAMQARAETTRNGGMAAVLQSSLERWFTTEFRARRPDIVDRVTKTLLTNDLATHAAIWEMIANFDVQDRLREINCPALILVGEHDLSTPPSAAAVLADGISDARAVILADAAHMVTVENPHAVNREIQRFLSEMAD